MVDHRFRRSPPIRVTLIFCRQKSTASPSSPVNTMLMMSAKVVVKTVSCTKCLSAVRAGVGREWGNRSRIRGWGAPSTVTTSSSTPVDTVLMMSAEVGV